MYPYCINPISYFFCSCRHKFEEFAQLTLSQAPQSVRLPPGKSVFDLVVDVKQGKWQLWRDRPLERPRPMMGHYNNTPEVTEMYCCFLRPSFQGWFKFSSSLLYNFMTHNHIFHLCGTIFSVTHF